MLIDLQLAGLARRLASIVYEAILLVPVLFIGALPFLLLAKDAQTGFLRLLFQIYLVVLLGVYFTWQWHHGGQTLPMKTWKMQVVMANGSPVTARIAILRYALAVLGLFCLGLGFLWALIDRDRQFLHDRLAGTRIILQGRNPDTSRGT